VTDSQSAAGYFPDGLPYNRLGHGPRPLVIFQGLMLENKPQSRLSVQNYRFLQDAYTVFVVLRKAGLPKGYTMKEMADDYAAMIVREFGKPVDIIGVSTGGSIAQHFAADHPELVRRLVLHSSAYVLNDAAKELQLRIAELGQQGRWTQVNAAMIDFIVPHSGMMKYLAKPIVWTASPLMTLLSAPKDPSDLVVTVLAEDEHDFKERLAEITAPTLVVAGDQDPFYSPSLFRETAEGIPNAKLILYPGMRHPAYGKQFGRDVLAFLQESCEEER
jgi:pimeloyl-ACP methyl ester carboxylesterase